MLWTPFHSQLHAWPSTHKKIIGGEKNNPPPELGRTQGWGGSFAHKPLKKKHVGGKLPQFLAKEWVQPGQKGHLWPRVDSTILGNGCVISKWRIHFDDGFMQLEGNYGWIINKERLWVQSEVREAVLQLCFTESRAHRNQDEFDIGAEALPKLDS